MSIQEIVKEQIQSEFNNFHAKYPYCSFISP